MKTSKSLLTVLAWLQILISLLLSSATAWGYATYQASLGQFVHSIADSIQTVSNVVLRTAETVEAKRDILEQTGKMFVVTRNLINELKVAVENQARSAPQYAEGIRSASSVASKLSATLQSIGDGLLFEVPTSIQMKGLKPTVIKSRPMEKPAEALKANARDIKVVSESLLGISTTISRDGQNLSSAFIATSDQALNLIAEAEKTLGRLGTQDLPKAIVDLRATSENLRQMSAQADIAGDLGLVLLVVGLLLAAWCLFNGVGMLMVANLQTLAPVAELTRSRSPSSIGTGI